jgi:hypothetical protein
MSESEADWLHNLCPRGGGAGADPDPNVHHWQPVSDELVPGERSFKLDVRCRQCGGSGRAPGQ